jgi:hypothetical protein
MARTLLHSQALVINIAVDKDDRILLVSGGCCSALFAAAAAVALARCEDKNYYSWQTGHHYDADTGVASNHKRKHATPPAFD